MGLAAGAGRPVAGTLSPGCLTTGGRVVQTLRKRCSMAPLRSAVAPLATTPPFCIA